MIKIKLNIRMASITLAGKYRFFFEETKIQSYLGRPILSTQSQLIVSLITKNHRVFHIHIVHPVICVNS